jgi:oxygen-independent coproporphyrinogen-3 oxidase
LVREVGFENFSCDLIYANPGQSLTALEADLKTALIFEPPHLSAYNLTFEEGTPFHRGYQAGQIRSLDEDDEVAMAELVENRLREAGLERYEISNYAKPGWHSRHNLNYWLCGDYLGLGAGAHSGRTGAGASIARRANERNPARYMGRIEESGCAAVEQETVERQSAAGEFLFLGLRMTRGISAEDFYTRFGNLPRALFPQIADWLQDGLMEERDGFLSLSRKGLLVANSIFVEFI